MGHYDQTAGYFTTQSRRQDTHDMIRDWRYLAAHKVAADEHFERLIAEAAQHRLVAATGVAVSWSPVIDRTRRCVGAVLIAVGMKIQGMSPTAQTAAAPARSGAAS